MRAILAAVTIALAAAVVAGSCPAPPVVDPFRPTPCPAYHTCDMAFCACAGASNTSAHNASTCLATSSASCATVEACLATYTACLMRLGETQRASTDAACNQTGTLMHAATLAAAVGAFNGSLLQASCRHRVCVTMNATRTQCTFGVNESRVCALSAPVQPAFALRATLRLSGSAYAALLNNPARRAALEHALQTDLAGLLRIDPRFIVILNLTLGSLIVEFAVLEGSGRSSAALDTSVQSARNDTTWLTTTRAVYSVVSNETITVLDVSVSEAGGTTAAPGGATPVGATPPAAGPTTAAPGTPGGTSAPGSSAAATSVAAAAAVALLGLALAM